MVLASPKRTPPVRGHSSTNSNSARNHGQNSHRDVRTRPLPSTPPPAQDVNENLRENTEHSDCSARVALDLMQEEWRVTAEASKEVEKSLRRQLAQSKKDVEASKAEIACLREENSSFQKSIKNLQKEQLSKSAQLAQAHECFHKKQACLESELKSKCSEVVGLRITVDNLQSRIARLKSGFLIKKHHSVQTEEDFSGIYTKNSGKTKLQNSISPLISDKNLKSEEVENSEVLSENDFGIESQVPRPVPKETCFIVKNNSVNRKMPFKHQEISILHKNKKSEMSSKQQFQITENHEKRRLKGGGAQKKEKKKSLDSLKLKASALDPKKYFLNPEGQQQKENSQKEDEKFEKCSDNLGDMEELTPPCKIQVPIGAFENFEIKSENQEKKDEKPEDEKEKLAEQEPENSEKIVKNGKEVLNSPPPPDVRVSPDSVISAQKTPTRNSKILQPPKRQKKVSASPPPVVFAGRRKNSLPAPQGGRKILTPKSIREKNEKLKKKIDVSIEKRIENVEEMCRALTPPIPSERPDGPNFKNIQNKNKVEKNAVFNLKNEPREGGMERGAEVPFSYLNPLPPPSYCLQPPPLHRPLPPLPPSLRLSRASLRPPSSPLQQLIPSLPVLRHLRVQLCFWSLSRRSAFSLPPLLGRWRKGVQGEGGAGGSREGIHWRLNGSSPNATASSIRNSTILKTRKKFGKN